MSSDDEPVPLSECTPPGAVTISRAAMALAERFQTVVPTGYIVVFSWHDGERVRAGKDAPWVDNGPGVGLGAYRTGAIPREVVCQSGALRYAVLIRQAVLAQHPARTIDLSENGRITLE